MIARDGAAGQAHAATFEHGHFHRHGSGSHEVCGGTKFNQWIRSRLCEVCLLSILESCSKVRLRHRVSAFSVFQSGAMADVDMGEVSAVGGGGGPRAALRPREAALGPMRRSAACVRYTLPCVRLQCPTCALTLSARGHHEVAHGTQ
jgi:hypothetical protein